MISTLFIDRIDGVNGYVEVPAVDSCFFWRNSSGNIATLAVSGFATLSGTNAWSAPNSFNSDVAFNGEVQFNNTIYFNASSGFSYATGIAAAHRIALGLGTLATQSGTFSGTSSGTNTGDQDLSGLVTLTSDQNISGFKSHSNWVTFNDRARFNADVIYGATAVFSYLGAAAVDHRAALGLGTLATQSGTFSGTSSGTNTGDNAVNTTSNAYADSLVVGLLDDRGNYNASGNVFPSSGGSGTAGAILKGDLWTISVAGTLGGVAVTTGDVLRALADTPGQTAGNWVISENNLGYVPQNTAGTLALAGFSSITGTIAISNIGGLGAGVGTALAAATGAAGGFQTKTQADAAYVGLTGNQTVGGDKTFTGNGTFNGQNAFNDIIYINSDSTYGTTATFTYLGTTAATHRTALGLGALSTVTPGTNVATFLTTPTSANLRAAVTDESGTGALIFDNGAFNGTLGAVTPNTVAATLATLSGTGAASVSPLLMTGAIYAAGTGTTNFPHLFIQPTGATAATNWPTGIALGMNLPSGIAQFLNLKVNGATMYAFGTNGTMSAANINVTSNVTASGALLAGQYVRVTPVVVASLPSAATAGAGAMSFVTDANTTLAGGLGNTVVGGGANFVPVHSNGSVWRIG